MKSFKEFLVENDERLARAKEMGFDVNKIWYHGSSRGFEGKGFDKAKKYFDDEDAFFFFDTAEMASKWALNNSHPAAVVLPVYLKLGKSNYIEFEGKEFPYDEGIGKLIKKYQMLEYNSIVLGNVKEAPLGIGTQAVVFNANQIRSIYAKFNLESVDSDDLLA